MTFVSLLFGAIVTAGVAGSSATAAADRQLAAFEMRLAQDPASLRVAAEYRELVIATGRYDRSIKLFERLAKDQRGGANRYLNLALATVDRVPVCGSIRAIISPVAGLRTSSRVPSPASISRPSTKLPWVSTSATVDCP